jgi:glycosyltransferase involved in cell wall biosynthesis
LNVLILTPDFPPIPGGVSTSIKRISTNLGLLGIKVLVVIPLDTSDDNFRNEFEDDGNVTVCRMFLPSKCPTKAYSVSNAGKLPQMYFYLHEIIKDFKPSVIHAFTLFPFATLAILLGQDYDLPVVLGIRGADLNINIFRPDIVGSLGLACDRAQAIVAVTYELEKRVQLITRNSKVLTIENGVAIRELSRIHTGKEITVGAAAARFSYKKNLEILISAIKRLDDPSIKLKVVGGIPEDQKSQISKIWPQIMLKDYVNDL